MATDQSDSIRALYEAFGRGDVPFIISKLATDLVWLEAENFIYADRNPYHGPQAVLEGVFLRIGTEWEGFTVSPEEIIGSGDSVIARGRYRGTCKATGRKVDAQFVHAWKLRDGQAVAFQQYTDTAQFRDAVTPPRAATA